MATSYRSQNGAAPHVEMGRADEGTARQRATDLDRNVSAFRKGEFESNAIELHHEVRDAIAIVVPDRRGCRRIGSDHAVEPDRGDVDLGGSVGCWWLEICFDPVTVGWQVKVGWV